MTEKNSVIDAKNLCTGIWACHRSTCFVKTVHRLKFLLFSLFLSFQSGIIRHILVERELVLGTFPMKES